MTKLIFIYLVLSTSKIFATFQKTTQESYMKGVLTPPRRLSSYDDKRRGGVNSEGDSAVYSCKFWSLGPFFEEESKAVSARYVQTLRHFLKPKLQDL